MRKSRHSWRLSIPRSSSDQVPFDKATPKILSCDQVTTLNKLAELSTLIKKLNVIIRLMYRYEGS